MPTQPEPLPHSEEEAAGLPILPQELITVMANEALQAAIVSQDVDAIVATLAQHREDCDPKIVDEARMLRDHLKKVAKKAKRKQLQASATENPDITRMPSGDAVAEPEPEVLVLEVNDDTSCIICLEAERSQLLTPCGHMCLCKGCAEDMELPRRCPICRGTCDNVVDLSCLTYGKVFY